MRESHSRSFAKGITWRIIASLTTMGIVYYLTGSAELVVAAGAIDVVLKLAFYYLHERAWGRVSWGSVRIKS